MSKLDTAAEHLATDSGIPAGVAREIIQAARVSIAWTQAPTGLRDFNGVRCTTTIGSLEYGVFEERHVSLDQRWAVYTRSLGTDREPTDHWRHPSTFETKREALAHVDAIAKAEDQNM